jgi:hypothetical protein
MWTYERTTAGRYDALLDALYWLQSELAEAVQDGEDTMQLHQEIGRLELIRLGG